MSVLISDTCLFRSLRFHRESARRKRYTEHLQIHPESDQMQLSKPYLIYFLVLHPLVVAAAAFVDQPYYNMPAH